MYSQNQRIPNEDELLKSIKAFSKEIKRLKLIIANRDLNIKYLLFHIAELEHMEKATNSRTYTSDERMEELAKEFDAYVDYRFEAHLSVYDCRKKAYESALDDAWKHYPELYGREVSS
jgi:hypothetical protein